MKISLAADDAEFSKKRGTEFEGRFSIKTTMQIISASESFLSIMKANRTSGPLSEIDAVEMMNTDQFMGSYHARGDHSSLQPAKNAVEDAVSTVYTKNANHSLSLPAAEDSPGRFVLKAVKNK
jgi:hypothetical protein